MPKDPYKTLGVHPHATDEELRAAYWQIARKVHPDASGCHDTAEAFHHATEAYHQLKCSGERTDSGDSCHEPPTSNTSQPISITVQHRSSAHAPRNRPFPDRAEPLISPLRDHRRSAVQHEPLITPRHHRLHLFDVKTHPRHEPDEQHLFLYLIQHLLLR